MSAATCAPAIGTVEVEPHQALHAARWLRLLGGIAVWACQDLSTPGRRFYTPAALTDGALSPRPHWSAPMEPDCVVTDPSMVEVVERREAARLRISVRPGGYGTRLKLTDASARRLHAALDRAGDGATYAFEGDEAVVYAVARRTPLKTWLEENGHAGEA